MFKEVRNCFDVKGDQGEYSLMEHDFHLWHLGALHGRDCAYVLSLKVEGCKRTCMKSYDWFKIRVPPFRIIMDEPDVSELEFSLFACL